MTPVAAAAPGGAGTPGLSDAARALLDQRAVHRRDVDNTIPRRHASGAAPLSPYQERLWAFAEMDPESAAYNRPRAFRLRGPLDVAALERALTEIVRRHESLRSALGMHDGALTQRPLPPERIALTITELGELPPDERDSRIAALLEAEARRPFDLASGALLRAGVVHAGADEHVLWLTLHHVASDGWSDSVLFAELGALYDAFTIGAASPLPELPLQYGDFAVWQHARETGDALSSERAYWATQLANAPVALELPADRPRGAESSLEGGVVTAHLTRTLTDALTALGRAQRATLSMTLLAAYQVLLSRLTGQHDVIVGVPVAGRTRPELEPLIGFFSNTLPLRTDLSDDPTFVTLLERVRASSLAAQTNQALSFDAIVQIARGDRASDRGGDRGQPLVQTMLNVRNTPPATLRMYALDVSPLETHAGRAVIDLNLEATEGPDGIALLAEYSADLFDRETVSRWLGHFRTLLESIVASPAEHVSRLRILTPEERHRAIVEWNATDTPLPFEDCLHSLVEAQAARTPHAIAVADESTTLTYTELTARARRLAAALQGHGVGPEARVGVCMERSADLVVALLAVLEAGGAYLPLDPSYPADRLAYMVEDAAPAVLLVDADAAERLRAPAIRTITLDATWWADESRAPVQPLARGVGPRNAAYVIYTSGSTGRPKGVVTPHRGICNRLLWGQQMTPLTASDVVLLKTPFSFDASVWEIFWPLVAGARLVVARPYGHLDSGYLADVIETSGVTTLHFVPSMLQRFIESPDVGPCASLVRIGCSGEALTPTLLRDCAKRFPHVEIWNFFGPTEASVEMTWWKCDPARDVTVVPIGWPIANMQLYVLDDRMEPVPVGVAGEIYIGGVGLARGYHDRPELTAERFVPHPFSPDPSARLYRTGDIGRQRADGVAEFLGRADHQVKIQGVRVELGEVEAAVRSHPAVRECVVMIQSAHTAEARLVAYVTPHAGEGPLVADRLRQHCRLHLPDMLVPAGFLEMDAFPLTPSGKVDRRALPPVPLGARDGLPPFREPRNPTEVMLARLWSDVLGVERVSIYDDFFALGGHSLAAAQVMARLRARLGVNAPVRWMFEHPTIAQLSSVLLALESEPSSPMVLLQRGSADRPPLFLLHGDFNGGGLYSRALARQLGADQTVYVLYPHEPGARDTIEQMADDYVHLIRAAAPGPYVLAGYCNGGAVAYEIAHRLRAMGERIALLTLIDWSAPNAFLAALRRVIAAGAAVAGAKPEMEHEVYVRAWEHVVRLAGFLPPPEPRPSAPAYLLGYARIVRSMLGGVSRRVYRTITRKQEAEETSIDAVRDTSPATQLLEARSAWYLRCVRSYAPPRYRGPITLVVPSGRVRRRIEDATFNWSRLADDVDMHVLPGTHLSLVGADVDALAATLRASIETAVGPA